MSNEIGKHGTPEEIELEAKRRELASLEEQVSERELELATIRAKLHHFEVTYLQEVGVYLTELDELKARIAEKLSAESPADETAQTEAKAAREQAAESSKATENLDEDDHTDSLFEPSDELKKLYLPVESASSLCPAICNPWATSQVASRQFSSRQSWAISARASSCSWD